MENRCAEDVFFQAVFNTSSLRRKFTGFPKRLGKQEMFAGKRFKLYLTIYFIFGWWLLNLSKCWCCQIIIISKWCHLEKAFFQHYSVKRFHCSKRSPLRKICHTYPTMIKPGTVINYLNKIQRIHKSCDAPLEFC